MKKFISLIIAILIIASAMAVGLNVSAASTNLQFSAHTINIGDPFTVTVTVNGGEAMYGVEADVRFDNSLLTFVSGDSSALQGDGSVKIIGMPAGATTGRYQINFTAKAAGRCTVQLTNVVYVGASETPVSGQSATVTIEAPVTPPPTPTPDPTPTPPPTPSTNANLASLRVSGATLSPAFSASTTSYTATVDNSVTKVTVSAGVADGGATFTGAGTFNLNVGDNEQFITVTAADGKTKKTYKLVIKRLAEGESTQTPEENPDDTTDPLLVITADGATRKIMHDISAMPVPYGFEVSSATREDITVGTYSEIDGSDYILYYLTDVDGANPALYYINSSNEFERLVYIEVNSKMYIIEEPKGNYAAPSGWYQDIARLGDTDVKAFKSENSKLADFYIICCYVDGKRGFYRFDSAESTLQRAPDFELVAISNNNTGEGSKLGLFKRFANMDTAGKVVIIFLLIAVVCIIALVVLMIIKIIRSSNNDEDDEDSIFTQDEFDYEEENSQTESDFDIFSTSNEEE